MKLSWRDWNNAIGRATFSEKQANRVVYLAVDQEEIGRIGRQFDLDTVAAYESFRGAVIDQVRDCWPNPSGPSQGQYPDYLADLAAQVVAAFQMHDDGLTGAKAYWRRLREFLGQSPDHRMPDGLKSKQHNALWKGLEKWANEINGKRLGQVQLAGKITGHYLVAEVLGQCHLRRADLEKLRDLFAAHGRPDPEPYYGRRLRELVDDARSSPPGRFFTKHSGRVLDDPDRRDAAWEQIRAEYKRFLADECPEAVPRKRSYFTGVRGSRPGTTVLLQLGRRGLIGRLYSLGGGPRESLIRDLETVLRRCYLREGWEASKPPPHKPPHDDFLLATRDGEYGAFVERRACRAGDDVLLLIPKYPESCSQAWLADADPCLFVDSPRCYRSPDSELPGWDPLEGLPTDWLALSFKSRDDLSAVTLGGKWIGAVERRAARVRAVGGLTLRRGVWMLGAGPTIQVVGPGNYDHVLIDGQPRPLDASRCATLELVAGKHRVCLPGLRTGALRFWIRKHRLAAPLECVGWHKVECGWPTSAGERRRIATIAGLGTLHGATLIGDWLPRSEPEPGFDVNDPEVPDGAFPVELAAMILALRLRVNGGRGTPDPQLRPATLTASALGVHPLIRGMLRASRSGICRGDK